MSLPTDDEVLLAFSVEEQHGAETLARYLARYPHLQDELLDLVHELALTMEFGPGNDESVGEDTLARATQRLLDSMPSHTLSSGDVFATALRSLGLNAISAATRLPLELLVAIRDRYLVPATVPQDVLLRLSRAATAETNDILGYLSRPAVLPAGVAHSSQTKPTAPDKMSFEAFLLDLDLTPEELTDLLSDAG